jgi:CheY-like chemotaxis protein
MARVLVAEDEAFTALALVDYLESLGHAVADASDGAGALSLAENFRPNVLITDLMMPVMDGAELIRRLDARPDGAIPVILITAVPEPRLPSELRYDGYLGKPVGYAALGKLIDRLAGRPSPLP